jgi:hypothetical protein
MHRKALILLAGKSTGSKEQCISYQQKIFENEYLDLVLEFSEPLLQSDPDSAIKVYRCRLLI